MESIIHNLPVKAIAVMDTSDKEANAAMELAPGVIRCKSFDEVLEMKPDGVVIATPSALHAEQSIRAINSGCAVFCQKPLARNAEETLLVVNAAKNNDRLLGIDFSYRFLEGMKKIKELIKTGDIGSVYAVDCIFHNAYGPDKSWFYNRELSGGGCVIDLGIHLVDLALWVFDSPLVTNVSGRCYASGKRVLGKQGSVEDYADAQIDLSNGSALHLACSWKLSAGQDAVINMSFYGTNGGLCLQNMNGSFYNFRTERFRGTSREMIHEDLGDWGGKAISNWVLQLIESQRYDSSIEQICKVSEVIDAIYG